ncbi:hypothetical protein EHRUM3_05580, partial [Ehrlichia ruminantium]
LSRSLLRIASTYSDKEPYLFILSCTGIVEEVPTSLSTR